MAGFQGADTEQLRQFGTLVDGRSEQIDELAAQLEAMIASVPWVGADADSFRADWSSRARPLLDRCGDQLRQRADELSDHAEEQDAASDGGQDSAAQHPLIQLMAASLPGRGISETLGRLGDAGETGLERLRDAGEGIRDAATDQLESLGDGAELILDGQRRLLDGGLEGVRAVAEQIGFDGAAELAFDDTGMQLEPPRTEDTITVDGDHELAPDGAKSPWGVGEDGAQIDLAPNTTYEVGDRGTFYTDGDGEIVYVEATGGGSTMNPNLREVFPDATYHVNENTYYQTDELGRTEHMYSPEVILDRDMTRSQPIQSKIAERWDMSGDGTSEPVEFNAGHVMARQLGGIREEINYTRQWDEVNQARSGKDTIYTYEDMMAGGIEDNGTSYAYETRINWGDGENQPAGVGPDHGSEPWEYVPESYDVRIHEEGEQIVDVNLPNYPEGARFPN